MMCSAKTIICDEIFDENSLPSEQEVIDYAIKIGINPETEKHLLNIALDGLMSPLPEDWKPCLDERVKRIYYYNVKTNQTQWQHPLDEQFETLVKKKRQEESISAGDDDSKTSIKEDLKSYEEAITTSDMQPSRNTLDNHKSRISSTSQMATKEGQKMLNPIGRPPLPPKRRGGSCSPKRGGLSLRLSPSPTRIDIDSLGLPLGLPSPEVKSERQSAPVTRGVGIKLTGGGSEFLKSNKKQSSSLTVEPKASEDPVFGIVREAESLDLPDEPEENKLKHSISLGESGFDLLTKSKKFASLQDSLSSLKNEMEAKSPSATALKGILREKPSPTTKLWDVDPVLLTREEKEKLRLQEMKDERKQNVRFADIINKPMSFSKSDLKDFSKTDSDDDCNTNDSSNDLDDFILEQTVSEDDLKRDNKFADVSPKADEKTDLNENDKSDSKQALRNDESLSNKNEKTNKNILSRLTDLNVDSEKKKLHTGKIKRFIENENNNSDESDHWLTDSHDMNQNEQRRKNGKKQFERYLENNSVDDSFGKTQNQTDALKSTRVSPSKLTAQYMDVVEKVRYNTNDNVNIVKSKSLDLNSLDQEAILDNSNLKTARGIRKSKLMPDMDIRKVFANLRDNLINSAEQSSVEGDSCSDAEVKVEVEAMQTSPQTEDRSQELRRLEEQQIKLIQQKKSALRKEYEENVEEIKREFERQESIEKQRFYMEVQQSVARYKEELDAEKIERETVLRAQCEDYLKELEATLSEEKEIKIKKMKESHELYLKEQEKKIYDEQSQHEEEAKNRIKTSSSQLEKVIADLKKKEESEIVRLTEESTKKINEIRLKIEQEQAEQENNYKQELAIVQAEFERCVIERKADLERVQDEQEAELAAVRAQQAEVLCRTREQCQLEEEAIRKRHAEKMETLNAQLSRSSEKEDVTLLNREFEKVRCEKRLLEDKYKSLKEKYLRLKNEVRLSLERKRQAKLNRQLQQQRDPASTTEDTTDRSTDVGKPPLARRKLTATLSSDEGMGENANETPKTIKRRPKTAPGGSVSVSSAAESSNPPLAKPKNAWSPSPRQRREGVSSAEDHTSVSEEIQMEHEENWIQSALSPLENLRKQLEKLDDLEEKFPTSIHTDTYLRYPFSGPAGASCELEFYRHRLHLERESVRRAQQALAEQRSNIEARQSQLRHKQHSDTLQKLHKEERELTDMEVALHRTRALLGEKIIRLRYLEQGIERAASHPPRHHSSSPPSALPCDSSTTMTDSSGFSGSDLDLSHAGMAGGAGRSDKVWTDSVLQSLENINGEIREIWTILGKKQVPGLGLPPMLNYEIGLGHAGQDTYSMAPYRATNIAERTRRLKEWLIRTRDQQTHVIAPVLL